MARGTRRSEESYGTDAPPGDISAPRTGPSLSHDYQFAMEIQKSIGELSAKLDRVIKDTEKQDDKLDQLRQQVSFVRGAVWVAVAVFTGAVALIGFFVANNVTISFGPQSPPTISAPDRGHAPQPQ